MASAVTISRAAERAGVGIETIRFYERRGLIEQPLKPRDGGYRLYDRETVERIRFIRQAQELGFALREIAELLALQADPDADCADVRIQAVAKRREVERKIGQLEDIRSALDVLIASCPGGGTLNACSIMEALSNHRTADAQAPSRHGSVGEQSQKAVFGVSGMHCAGCARALEEMLRSEPGVDIANVSFERREAQIGFDPRATGAAQLEEAIAAAGYSVSKRSR